MKTVYERNASIPDYALSYLINGDDSGLENDDKKIIDNWLKEYQDKTDFEGGHFEISINYDDTGNPDTYFTWNPEFGLACDVTNCTIMILVND